MIRNVPHRDKQTATLLKQCISVTAADSVQLIFKYSFNIYDLHPKGFYQTSQHALHNRAITVAQDLERHEALLGSDGKEHCV